MILSASQAFLPPLSCILTAFNYDFYKVRVGWMEPEVRSGQKERQREDGGRMCWSAWRLCKEWKKRQKERLLVLLHQGRHAWIYGGGLVCVRMPVCVRSYVCVCVCGAVSKLLYWPCETPKKLCLNSFNAMTLVISSGFIARSNNTAILRES